MKKFLCSALSALMMVSAVAPVAAQANQINSAGTGSSTVVLNVDAPTFSVTVPTGLPIYVDADGVVTTANNVYITNGGHGAVTVTGVAITAKNDWTTVDVAKDLSNVPVNTQEFSMTINNETTTGADAITFDQENWPAIAAANDGDTDQFHLVYDADVAPQTNSLNKDIADVVFTVGWNTADGTDSSTSSSGGSSAIVPEVLTDYYTFTDDPITGGWKVGLNSNFKTALNQADPVAYEEWNPGDPLPVLPNTYQGKPVTSYSQMFYQCYNVKSLDLSGWDTSNVTDLGSIFTYCNALTSLDLSGWDTSKVTNMGWMFCYCIALKDLDIKDFDTSNVTVMNSMFAICWALTDLDLSNFDTSKVTDTNNMFGECKALTTCYGRSSSDCDKLNSSSGKPFNVNFGVNLKFRVNSFCDAKRAKLICGGSRGIRLPPF